MMMTIKYIAVHCSATPPTMDIGVKEIRKWHVDKGWDDVGYHVIIRRNGEIEWGRSFGVRGAHVKGYNSVSLGVCLIGGVDSDMEAEDNFTDEQFSSLERVLTALQGLFPDTLVMGHRDIAYNITKCPSFDAQGWWENKNGE